MILGCYLLLSFFSFQNSVAQNGFSWSAWVGCATGINDLKNYTELIESGGCHRVCQQSTVTYTITGTVPAQIRNTIWNVVGGTIVATPNSAQCIVTWDSSTVGSIGYTTTQVATNNPVTISTLCVSLTKNPEANFAIAPIIDSSQTQDVYNACTGQEVFFENLSTTAGGTAISSYYWDFGDGTSSSSQNTSHIYTVDGIYDMKLTVTNQCNCTSAKSYRIEVKKKGVQITCASIACEGQKATYKVPDDFATSCSVFNWEVVGGTILSTPPYGKTIEVLWDQYNTEGFGYVTFNPTGCNAICYVASTLKIPIISSKMDIVGDTTLCGPNQVRYKLPQWPTTDFRWEIENKDGCRATLTPTDQRNEVLVNTGSEAGTAILNCIYTNTLLNCGGVAKPLELNIKQTVKIEGSLTTCVGATETYIANTTQSVTWTLKKLPNGPITNYPDNVLTIDFTTPGNYSLSANAATICNPEPMLISVSQNEIPFAADFTSPLTICPGVTTTYTFNNTVPGTRINWQVTGGVIMGTNLGNSVDINFGYPIPSGTAYTIRLFRENIGTPACHSGTLILNPTVPTPLVSIKGATITEAPNSNPCGSSMTNYRVTATDMDFYEWTLRDPQAGSISVNAIEPWKVTVLWNQFSNYNTELRLRTKKCNQLFNTLIPITVSSPVITMTATATEVCRGVEQRYRLSSNLLSQTGAILWDFGNGVTRTTNTTFVDYTYSNISASNVSYLVKATIVNPNGCTSIVTTIPITIVLKVAPVAVLTPSSTIAVPNSAALMALPVATRTLSASITGGFAGTTAIKWYKNNALISPQPPLLTSPYVVTDFGEYYAEVFNSINCTQKTNIVKFERSGNVDANPCTGTLNPILTLTNNCGSIRASVANVGSPTTVSWSSSMTQTGTATNIRADFTTLVAGQHTVYYRANYIQNGVACQINRTATIIVPYIPDLKYTVACSTGLNYTVRLLDNSNFYASTQYNSVVYKVTKINTPAANVVTTLTAAQITNGISLPEGNYMARIEIRKTSTSPTPAYPMCAKEIPFTLVAKPTVAFTASSKSVCKGEPVFFTLTTPVNPNWKYLWDFDSGITNTQPNAFVTFSEVAFKFVKVTVTDQNGCSFTTTPLQIVVKEINELNKPITSIVQCLGSTASLQFPVDIDEIITGYKWMLGNAPAPGNNTTNPYSTSTAGNYWLQTANINNCYKRVVNYSASVSFINVPFPVIQSLPEVCLNSPVPLQSSVGDNPSYQYIWRRNGTLVSISSTAADFPDAIGTYSYTLEVRAALSNGTFCSKISNPYTVTIIPLPTINSLVAENYINPDTGTCNPFVVTLKATADAIGTYTWSNGMSGATISVTVGGAYDVLFTSPSGCSTRASIYVPKDLSSYMWIVPKGCYTFCTENKPTQQLLGPAVQEFANWAWLQNAVPIPAGIEAVTTKDLDTTANYQLLLSDTSCNYKSDPLSITMTTCNTNCDWLRVRTESVFLETNSFLQCSITLRITNNSTTTLMANVTSANVAGFFLPATLDLLPGTHNYTVSFVPNSIVAGTSVKVYITVPNANGTLCQQVTFASIPNMPVSSKMFQNGVTTGTNLLVYPNPANDAVTIRYEYPTGSQAATLQLYDTTARLLHSYQPASNKGDWELELRDLAAGIYLVVLKQNGEVIAQQSIVKK